MQYIDDSKNEEAYKYSGSGLEPLRKEIDEIDRTILSLFERRMEVVKGVGLYKKENNIPILNEKREVEVIDKIVNMVNNRDIEKEAVELFLCLMEVSRDYQQMILKKANQYDIETILNTEECSDIKENCNAVYQGVPGSFSEEALDSFFNEKVIKNNVKDFEDVFIKLKEDEMDFGVLPIENSSTGGIVEVYDLLRKYNLYIVGEQVVKVNQNLLGVKGAQLKDIKEVYSHPQGFSQSAKYLKDKPWNLIPYINTATSAKFIKDSNDKSKAAIASKKAGEIYGLDVIAEEINFNNNNSTRFIIVGKKLNVNKNSNKISIVFSTPHQVGALYKVLAHIAKNSLNMIKIESRPMENKPWEYFFYVDIEGNIQDEIVKSAVDGMKKECNYFTLLGNYKAYF